ncbi:MAG: hypothetical protein ABJO27_11855 [Pseudoruegeria sp.]
MPLTVLLPMVVFGILGIAILLHFLGLSRPMQFNDDASVSKQFHRLNPALSVHNIVKSSAGTAAIVSTSTGPYLIWAFGADCTSHSLMGADIIAVPRGVRVRLNDFASPGPTISLTDSEKPIWLEFKTGDNT